LMTNQCQETDWDWNLQLEKLEKLDKLDPPTPSPKLPRKKPAVGSIKVAKLEGRDIELTSSSQRY